MPEKLTPVHKGLFSEVKRALEQYNDLSSGDLLLIWLVVSEYFDEHNKQYGSPPKQRWTFWYTSLLAVRLVARFGFNYPVKKKEALDIVKVAALKHPALNKHLLKHRKS